MSAVFGSHAPPSPLPLQESCPPPGPATSTPSRGWGYPRHLPITRARACARGKVVGGPSGCPGPPACKAQLGLTGCACAGGDYWREQGFRPSPCGDYRALSRPSGDLVRDGRGMRQLPGCRTESRENRRTAFEALLPWNDSGNWSQPTATKLACLRRSRRPSICQGRKR
jgi:hypothetical protein